MPKKRVLNKNKHAVFLIILIIMFLFFCSHGSEINWQKSLETEFMHWKSKELHVLTSIQLQENMKNCYG